MYYHVIYIKLSAFFDDLDFAIDKKQNFENHL